MTGFLICANLTLTPLPPLHENSIQDYTEFGQARVDMPEELVDVLYKNRAEGRAFEACLDLSQEELVAARIQVNETSLRLQETQRELRRRPTWGWVGAGLVAGLVGGIYLGATAAR